MSAELIGEICGALSPAMLPSRFTAKVRVDGNGCWIFTPAHEGKYGRIYRDGKIELTHRAAYMILVGPIPDGLDLDHLCRVRPCCNPAHLEPVDRRTNLLRGQTVTARNAAATHCPAGHPYDAENTRIRRGWRECRTCTRDRKRKPVRSA